jgi:hypothetical protein
MNRDGSQNCLAVLHRSTMRKLGESCVLLVFFLFHSKLSTMAAAGAIQRGHLPDGGI